MKTKNWQQFGEHLLSLLYADGEGTFTLSFSNIPNPNDNLRM